MSMFTEGYETSSSVLAFAMYEMARNPDIQERLYQEIDDVLAKYDGECPFEALQEMEYLDMVIHETMRLDVVAPLISRICTKEYTMPLIEGQKEPVVLQPGTAVQINCRTIHMFVDFTLFIFFDFCEVLIRNLKCRNLSFETGTQNITQTRRYSIPNDFPQKSVENERKQEELPIYRLAKDQEVKFKLHSIVIFDFIVWFFPSFLVDSVHWS